LAADFTSASNFGHASGSISRLSKLDGLVFAFFLVVVPDMPTLDEVRKKLVDIPQEYAEYLMLLGRLYALYPAVENSLFGLLGVLTMTHKPIGVALFGDQRTDSLMSMINRVLAARPEAYKDRASGPLTPEEMKLETFVEEETKYVFAQLGDINGIRNQLTHHGSLLPVYGEEKITNALRASPKTKIDINFTTTDLACILYDISNIIILLGWLVACVLSPTREDIRGRCRAYREQHPWLYKSPRRGETNQSRQRKPQAQTPPPPASEG